MNKESETQSDRHQIMEDAKFWEALEHRVHVWLQSAGDESLRQQACDGFVPMGIRDTKGGVEVQGAVWWLRPGTETGPTWFFAYVPQKLLQRSERHLKFKIEQLTIDKAQKTLFLEVGYDAPKKVEAIDTQETSEGTENAN